MQPVNNTSGLPDLLQPSPQARFSATDSFVAKFSAAWQKLETISANHQIVHTCSASEAISRIGFKAYLEELRRDDLREQLKIRLLSELDISDKILKKMTAMLPPEIMKEFERRIDEEVEKRLEAVLMAEKKMNKKVRNVDDAVLTELQREKMAQRLQTLKDYLAYLDKTYCAGQLGFWKGSCTGKQCGS